MVFASTVDLELIAGVNDERKAQAALELATGLIQAEARQTISLVEDDEIQISGNWSSELWLPQRPVVEVASIAVNGLAIVAGGYTWSPSGQLYRGIIPIGNGPDWDDNDLRSSNWGGPASKVEVTYTHGFEVIPQDLRALCLAVAARILTNPGAADSVTIGNFSKTNAQPNAGELTDDERKICARYRIDVRSISVG